MGIELKLVLTRGFIFQHRDCSVPKSLQFRSAGMDQGKLECFSSKGMQTVLFQIPKHLRIESLSLCSRKCGYLNPSIHSLLYRIRYQSSIPAISGRQEWNLNTGIGKPDRTQMGKV